MNIHINDFDGPLDLLLHLVKESKMDIYEIKISLIIDQYLQIIQNMQDLNIDVASSYLVMSAELLHLKSKKLINQKLDDEEEEFEYSTEEQLKNHLLEYQLYKNVTKEFEILKTKRNEVYTRLPQNLNEYFEDKVMVNNSITLDDLLKAFINLKQRESINRPIQTRIGKQKLNVNSQIKYIRNILKLKTKINFSQLFESYSKDYVIVTFLSVLSMSHNNEIILQQVNNFDDILIQKVVRST